jgi:hypothetical protein
LGTTIKQEVSQFGLPLFGFVWAFVWAFFPKGVPQQINHRQYS